MAPNFRRTAILGVASVLGLRGALGVMGKTEVLAPGSNSERFVRLDRRIYAPLCLGLSVGCLASGMSRPSGKRSLSHPSLALR